MNKVDFQEGTILKEICGHSFDECFLTYAKDMTGREIRIPPDTMGWIFYTMRLFLEDLDGVRFNIYRDPESDDPMHPKKGQEVTRWTFYNDGSMSIDFESKEAKK